MRLSVEHSLVCISFTLFYISQALMHKDDILVLTSIHERIKRSLDGSVNNHSGSCVKRGSCGVVGILLDKSGCRSSWDKCVSGGYNGY